MCKDYEIIEYLCIILHQQIVKRMMEQYVARSFPLEEEYKKPTGITPEDIERLRQWLYTQPHLPQEHITDLDLILSFHSCKRCMETTKKLLDTHYTMKTNFTALFKDRVVDDNIDLVLDRVAVLMVIELWQYEEGTWPGLVIIYDLEGLRLGHLFKLDVEVLKQFLTFLEQSMLVKIKAIHLLNAPYFIDKLVAIVHRLIKCELFNVLKIHQSGKQTLGNDIDISVLPENIGGDYKTFEECKEETLLKIKANKRFFENELKKRGHPSLRASVKNNA